jgi:hypothetical protein
MRTAIQLAIHYRQQDPDNWDEDETSFRIRYRTVPFNDVRRYFTRKSIHDPFEWFRSLPPEDYQPSEHVHLIPRGEFVLTPMDHHQSPELTVEEGEGVGGEEYFTNNGQLTLPSPPAESLIPRQLTLP